MAFLAWTAVGALFGAAYVSLASVGIFVLPVAAGVLALVLRRYPAGAATTGVVSGLGLALFGVGLLNVGGDACEGEAGSCGAVAPAPWLVAGAVATVGGVVAYLMLRRRGAGPPPT